MTTPGAASAQQIWVDGGLKPIDAAQISVLDRGFTVGDGVFETLKLVDGVPFALSRHLGRLTGSARGLGLALPDLDAVRAAVAATVEANRSSMAPVARLRITWTGGSGALGSERGDEGSTLVVAVGQATAWPASDAVVVVPWRRNEFSAVAGLKTTSYAENVVALATAHAAGAGEALFANTAGDLCEGTGSNVFVVLEGRVLTPALRSGCLAGITRSLVLQWCEAEEADLPLSVLREADEVMLTSSTRDVQAVHAVDGRELIGSDGPMTQMVQRNFAEHSADELDP